MTWLLAYLLTGFVLRFIATEIMLYETDLDWHWELAATLLYPIAIVCGLIVKVRERRR